MELRSIIFVGLLAVGVGSGLSIDGQTIKRNDPPRTVGEPSFARITQKELYLLLADLGDTNPTILKNLEGDPELRRAQLANLKQLLAFAMQAQKDGLASTPLHARELRYIREETTAVHYDRHLNKGNAKQLFSLISEAHVDAYWGQTPGSKMSVSMKTARTKGFQEFLETKVALLKAAGPEISDREITEEERQQARDVYAKINIYADEYAKRSPLLPRSFHEKVDLQVKLQQAQFLARLYAEKVASRAIVSEQEVASYIKDNPVYDVTAKRTKAIEILARAKAGEDFAKLANEFSEDPGNKNPAGELQGGLYQNVKKGMMVPSFEQAALALDAGQVSPELVESDYGFHIVKLERKGKSGPDTPETYDVRHILIATGVPGADGRFVPLKEYVKRALETEKEERIVDELVTANQISVPDDFAIPIRPSEAEPEKTTAPVRRRKAKPGSIRKRN